MDVQALQTALGHEFASKDLLSQALTHRSHSVAHNERLEFLGDSVLNCVIASLLFDKFSKIDEGDLSRLRANLVKQQSLYEIAQRLELSQHLRLGEGELKSGGFRRPSILADTVEALFGAVFLDAGFDVARRMIKRLYQPVLDTVDPKTLGKDAKTLLQEYLQGRKIALPVYTVVATHGAAHSQEFEVECAVAKLAIQVLGAGGSRRAAEQAAAKKALEAAQALTGAATKRTRRAKSAQLSLPVSVEQSQDTKPVGSAGLATASARKAADAKPREADATLAKTIVERASTRAATPIEPARIVASANNRQAGGDAAAVSKAKDVKPEVKTESKADVKPDDTADARPETKAAPRNSDAELDDASKNGQGTVPAPSTEVADDVATQVSGGEPLAEAPRSSKVRVA